MLQMLDIKYSLHSMQTGTIWSQQCSPTLFVMPVWCFGASWGPMRRWWYGWVCSTRDIFTHFFELVTLLFVIPWHTEGASLSWGGRWKISFVDLRKHCTAFVIRILACVILILQRAPWCKLVVGKKLLYSHLIVCSEQYRLRQNKYILKITLK